MCITGTLCTQYFQQTSIHCTLKPCKCTQSSLKNNVKTSLITYIHPQSLSLKNPKNFESCTNALTTEKNKKNVQGGLARLNINCTFSSQPIILEVNSKHCSRALSSILRSDSSNFIKRLQQQRLCIIHNLSILVLEAYL